MVSSVGWHFVLFTLGHALGSMPHVTRGAQEAALFQTMQSYRFPIMGFTRSHWDFYRGFSLSISLDLAIVRHAYGDAARAGSNVAVTA